MKKNIPLYDINLTDESVGMYAIALVDLPAVESELFMFHENTDTEIPQLYKLSDTKEHCILSCVIRTDFPIYRKDEDGYEYYIQFSKDTAKQIVQRFFKNGFQCNVNLMHTDIYVNDDIELREMFIKDTEKGINPKGFENIAEGSVFAVYQIKNQQLWDEIENGSFRGLSLEGQFKPVKVEEKEDKKELTNIKELTDFLRNFNN